MGEKQISKLRLVAVLHLLKRISYFDADPLPMEPVIAAYCTLNIVCLSVQLVPLILGGAEW